MYYIYHQHTTNMATLSRDCKPRILKQKPLKCLTIFVSYCVDNPQHFCGPSEAACSPGIFWWFSLFSETTVQWFLGPERLVGQKKMWHYITNSCSSTYIGKGMTIKKKIVHIRRFCHRLSIKTVIINWWSVQQWCSFVASSAKPLL